jgi:Zn finger protein HypA/HybF involved in hydrogenase expression
MIVDGFCRKCQRTFDAHWSNYPDLSEQEAILRPYCPYCKCDDVYITTDDNFDEIETTEEDDDL